MKHILYIVLFSIFMLTACFNSEKPLKEPYESDRPRKTDFTLPPIKSALSCLPKENAFIAAHRGTSRNQGLAENSLSALSKLIEKGFYISEIDVASLKDNTLILMHDGVLDRTTIRKGPFANLKWPQVDGLLLRDTEGNITSDTVPRLSDILAKAKHKIYLEIDFKSSARYEDVLKEIRQHDMQKHVILIAYTDGQARKLAKLAPEMMISIPVKNAQHLSALNRTGIKTNQIAAWTGKETPNSKLRTKLNQRKIPILSMPTNKQKHYAISYSKIIVTDYALDTKPILGRFDKKALESCLYK